MIFVDTSAFVALYDPEDMHRPLLLPEWRRLQGTQDLLFTSDVILAQTLSYLAYEVDAETARRAGREILRSPHVRMVHATPDDHWRALDLLNNFAGLPRKRRPGYVDCTSFAIMRRMGIRSAFVRDAHFLCLEGIDLIPPPLH